MPTIDPTNELYSSQIPALKTLMSLGWDYLSSTDCLKKRGDVRAVILRDVLIDILQQRRFEFKGKEHALSPNAIEQILRELSSPGLNEGLLTANERLYDRLCLGITVTEFIDGKKYSPTIPIIDWNNIKANSFIVSDEMQVLNTDGTRAYRPDIVCFVNGLPLVVIEAKRATAGSSDKEMIEHAITQIISYQKADKIPALFVYSQLLLAINSIDARYATTKTEKKFWARWREEEFTEADFDKVKNIALSEQQHAALFEHRKPEDKDFFEQLWAGPLLPSEQDRLLISLLSPERLLEFVRYFILYDNKVGKIAARYPQMFGVKAMLDCVNGRDKEGKREGGVLWHTTGSGKSFTMVYFCRALLLHPELKDCRIIVVTDRTDLEIQLSKTFISSGAFGSIVATKKEGEQARVRSGKDLARRIGKGDERIIFTIINKFNNASKQPECFNDSDKLIVLIDEGHRSQGGENHERMRRTLPNAAYVAFTGTPLLKNDKTTNQFGPIRHAYTMQRAVEDGTVTPLLYEQRRPDLTINDEAIDNEFDKFSETLSEQQKADLKKKFSRKGAIYQSENRIAMIAEDIAEHFSQTIKELKPGLKGQLACDSKLSAIRYKKFLDATGKVSSAVIISSPDSHEGHEAVDEASTPAVQQWWKDHVNNADNYERDTINNFSSDGEPDILIVVDKLLTGFDEPRNAVLYIDKPLKEHNLIQAVARVNRLHDDKQFGLLIDYRGILEELDTAVKKFQDLAERTQSGYDIDDIEGLYHQLSTEYRKLPALHSALWAFFAGVENKLEPEYLRHVLLPKFAEDRDGLSYDTRLKIRHDFYAALTEFGLCLSLALSSRSFFQDSSFSEDKVQQYKVDLKRFVDLRQTLRRDTGETVNYSSYELQVRKLVDTQVVGNEIAEPEGQYVVTALAQNKPAHWSVEKTRNETDLIRTRIQRKIDQELNDDPYAQKVFSELLKAAIAEAEALFDHPDKQYALFSELENVVTENRIETIPAVLQKSKLARKVYGAMITVLDEDYFAGLTEVENKKLVNETLAIEKVIELSAAEHSLNMQSMEAEIRQKLLTRLFPLIGIENTNRLIEQILYTVRTDLSRGDL